MSNKFENEELDAIIQALGQAIEADEQRTGILSPERLQQMEGAYRLLLELAKETDAVVTYQLNAPFRVWAVSAWKRNPLNSLIFRS